MWAADQLLAGKTADSDKRLIAGGNPALGIGGLDQALIDRVGALATTERHIDLHRYSCA
jgi:hypothetical protein